MPKLIIEAGRAERHYWADLWRFRELLYFLAWRDILVRYKQTVIGIAWAIIRPLLTTIIFTVIFGRIAKMPAEGVPYPLLIFAGMLPWQFFANAVAESSASLVGNSNLISKVYFPRLIVPASAVIVSLVDVLICFSLLIGLFGWYQFWPTWRIATLPLLMLLTFLAALGPGLLITALNVQYRDFRYIIPFIVQFGLYISPVGFSSSVVPEQWRLLYHLNPMAGVIDAFRWAICGTTINYRPGLILSLAVTIVFLYGGIYYFRRMERTFADVI
ncbi:MAG: ABC transporter permease [Acidobacteria bacterium]|nr:ABC transporter permease [Acidobacteriota bacterium]